jgi:hypothetical protein
MATLPMLRWTVSDGRVRSTLMGIKPPVRQGNMLGGNVGLVFLARV